MLNRSEYQAGSGGLAGNGDGDAALDFVILDFPEIFFLNSFLNAIPDQWIGGR